jgi:uncharacterized protein YqeY
MVLLESRAIRKRPLRTVVSGWATIHPARRDNLAGAPRRCGAPPSEPGRPGDRRQRHAIGRGLETLGACHAILNRPSRVSAKKTMCDKTDAAADLRQRLQSDLRSAMKEQATRDVEVLRQLIAAIDNAGAVPLPPKTEPIQCEVERRSLGRDDIQALVQREFELRRHAADEFSRLGRTVEAESAKFEMDVIARYMRSSAEDSRRRE